jgi:ABC-type transport system involved in multi-copper enzyme maturation permease subunit
VRAFFAIVRDAFREATDRWISTALLLISISVAIGAFLFTGVEAAPLDGLVRGQIAQTESAPESVRVEPVDARTVDIVVDLARATQAQALRLPRIAEHLRASLLSRGARAVEVTDPGPAPDGAPRRRVTVDASPLDLRGGGRIVLGIGVTHVIEPADLENVFGPVTARDAIAQIETALVVQLIAGWAGLIVAIVATAGFVSSLLAPSAVQLFLARPVRRSTLLLGKYAGGVAFVAMHATIVTGLVELAIWARSGYFEPRFLLAPLCVAGVFAILYAASVLAAVLTETPAIAILAALALWLCSWAAFSAKNFPRIAEETGQHVELSPTVVRAIDGAYWVLPKTSDLFNAFNEAMLRGRRAPEAERLAAKMGIDVEAAAGTSALFTVVLLGAACVVFSRRDY